MGKKKRQEYQDKIKKEQVDQQSVEPNKPAENMVVHPETTPLSKQILWYLPFQVAMLIVYLLTMCPTVPGGDSGELITVSYRLGVAHPPGYPLYTLLAHLWTYIPIGSVAWRVNLFSAFCMLGTAFFIFLIVERWLKQFWLAVFASVLYALSPLVWRYALVAEVFGLNCFLISALVYITYRYLEEPKDKWAYWWSGTLGLACAHHHTVIMVAIPLFLMLIIRHYKHLLSFRTMSICLGLFILGMTPYLALPLWSKERFIFSWGALDSWKGFWLHFLRKEYGTFQLAAGESNYSNLFFNMYKYSRDLMDQFLFVLVIPVIVGIWLETKKRKAQMFSFGFIILVSCFTYLVVFHTLANMDVSNRLFYDVQSRFWMLPNIFMSIFAASGLYYLSQRWHPHQKKIWATAAILTGILQVTVWYKDEDMSKNWIFRDLGKSTLDAMEPNSLYLIRGDVYVNSVRYMQACEDYRTDVKAIPFDLLWWPWMKDVINYNFKDVMLPGKLYRYEKRRSGDYTMYELLTANIERMPVYLGKLRDDEQKLVDKGFKLWNMGFVNRVYPKGQDIPLDIFTKYSEPFEQYPVAKKDEIRDKSWEAFIFYNYWDRQIDRSRQIFSWAMEKGIDDKLIRYGARVLERVVEEYPEPPGHAYRNLGVAYQFMSRTEPKYKLKMIDMWERYLAMGPQNDSELDNIRAIIMREKASIPTEGAISIKN